MPQDEPNFDQFIDDVLEEAKKPPKASPNQFLANLEVTENLAQPTYTQVALVTTQAVPGRAIVASKGIVSGRVVKGQGIWKNFKMLMGSDGFGGRSGALEKDFALMEQECYRQLKVAAFQRGANAVVAVSLQLGETSGEADLFYAFATGTAVVCE